MWKNELLKVWPSEVAIYTDGASRGNPGPSAFGVVVLSKKGETVLELAHKVGKATNNVAEYLGVRTALELASLQKNTLKKVTLKTDSQLLIRQIQGKYKVKASHLKPIFLECRQFIERIPYIEFYHIPREENTRADELANQILDGFL